MKIKNNLLLIITAVILSILIAGLLVIYFYNFNGKLSNNSSDWANIGSYIGGLATPFISLIALLALLKTIQLQKNEFSTIIDGQRYAAKYLQEQLDISYQSLENSKINNNKQTILRLLEQFISNQNFSLQESEDLARQLTDKDRENGYYNNDRTDERNKKNNSIFLKIENISKISMELAFKDFKSIEELNKFIEDYIEPIINQKK